MKNVKNVRNVKNVCSVFFVVRFVLCRVRVSFAPFFACLFCFHSLLNATFERSAGKYRASISEYQRNKLSHTHNTTWMANYSITRNYVAFPGSSSLSTRGLSAVSQKYHKTSLTAGHTAVRLNQAISRTAHSAPLELRPTRSMIFQFPSWASVWCVVWCECVCVCVQSTMF